MTTILDPLVDLLRGLEDRPISSSERFQIESEVQCFVDENKIKTDSLVLQSLSDRLTFAYFPTVSNLKKVTTEPKPPSSNGAGSADTSKQDSTCGSGHRDYYNLALQPALPDVFYTCNIKRIKSALSTSYRMSIECVKSLKNTSDGAGEKHYRLLLMYCVNGCFLTSNVLIVILKLLFSSYVGFFDNSSCGTPVMIFGAKKLKNGSALILTSSQAESKGEWKDKDAVGKIARSGTGYTYMGRLYTDKIQDKDRNTTYSQDVSHSHSLASNDTSFDNSNLLTNQAQGGLQEFSGDRSNSLHGTGGGMGAGTGTGVRTISGPLAVSVTSSGSDKLIQASVVVADTLIVDRYIEGKRDMILVIWLRLSV